MSHDPCIFPLVVEMAEGIVIVLKDQRVTYEINENTKHIVRVCLTTPKLPPPSM